MQNLQVVFVVIIAIALSAWISIPRHYHSDVNPYHSRVFVSAYGGLPDTTNSMFTGSGKCAGCHATDPNFYASIVGQTFPALPMPDGHDVNPTDMWRSSIMANSAKDPFWRAKVTHEVAVNPAHQAELEDKCTSCHAPLGHFAAHNDGFEHYSLEMLGQDSLALDGVSCVACHQQSLDSSGISFSGVMHFDSAIIYGPYGLGKNEPPIYDLPMLTYSFYAPMYGAHIAESTICADCHTLITQTADLDGNTNGEEFVEQATYHEWVNSAFSGQGVDLPEDAEEFEGTCQTCHMPRIDEQVIISSGYAFLEPRSPYGLHQLAGANTAMLEIMRDNLEELGLTASAEQFDSTLLWTQQMLTEKTLDLELVEANWEIIPDNNSFEFVVRLKNKAGHKFPSGYPSRRAFVEFIVTEFAGDTIYHSGKMDSSGASILNSDEVGLSDYEPHYDVITTEHQVQIYEIVAGNVENTPTNLLERAAVALKDNRLVPYGFSMNHNSYDTTRVEGEALYDPNFNSIDGELGTGSDDIIYSLPIQELTSDYDVYVEVNVWYQSMPPRWVNSMFDYESPEIELFQNLYEDHGSAPVLVATVSHQIATESGVDYIDNHSFVSMYPNPSFNGDVRLTWHGLRGNSVYEIYNSAGARIQAGSLQGSSGSKELRLPNVSGMYLVKIHHDSGVITKRVARK